MQNVQLFVTVLLLIWNTDIHGGTPRLLQSEFEYNELLLPYPSRENFKLRVPPCAYPDMSNYSRAAMVQVYHSMMADMRTWLRDGHAPEYLPTVHEFKSYAHHRNHMSSMSIAEEGGTEVWARIYMTFLHYATERAWGMHMPGQSPGWCRPWPSCRLTGQTPLPTVPAQWCQPFDDCVHAGSMASTPIRLHVTSIRVPLASTLDAAEECVTSRVVVHPSVMLHTPRSQNCPVTAVMLRFENLPLSSGWVSEQPVTESSVEWHLDEELWTAASSYTTPDLAILLSEIIQLDDWQPGSSISFLVKPHDLEAMMTLAVATQSTISHGQESSQLRYRTIATSGLQLLVTWREPDPEAAALAAIAALQHNQDSELLHNGLRIGALSFSALFGCGIALRIGSKCRRHQGKRYSRLPMSGIEIDSRVQDTGHHSNRNTNL